MFAREGYPFMMGALALAALAYVGALRMRSWPLWLLAFTLTVIALWVAWFFRNPERAGERGEQVVVSPADGRVVLITHIDEPTFVDGPTVRVSVFMNVFDVHVNRAPVEGSVELIRYIPGKFFNASLDKASTDNERNIVVMGRGADRFTMVQIAGLVARRIVCWAEAGDILRRGERFGLIKFGSRVDLYLPDGYAVKVYVGETVRAGETAIAVRK